MGRKLQINFRINEEEEEKLNEKVAAANVPKGEFIRNAILNDELIIVAAPAKDSLDKKKLIFYYNKTSNNMNQLAHHANLMKLSGELNAVQFEKILGELIQIRAMLKTGIDNVD